MLGDCPDPVRGTNVPGLHIWGWTHREELMWLYREATRMRDAAEIGVLHGRSAFALLTGCPGPVYCIDPYSDDTDDSLPSFLGSCGHFPNLRVVQGFSPQVITEANLPDVDMTFVDGNHDEAQVRADITGWLPKTRRLICGHDYCNENGGYPDVAKVVDETFGKRVRVAPDTSIWYVEL